MFSFILNIFFTRFLFSLIFSLSLTACFFVALRHVLNFILFNFNFFVFLLSLCVCVYLTLYIRCFHRLISSSQMKVFCLNVFLFYFCFFFRCQIALIVLFCCVLLWELFYVSTWNHWLKYKFFLNTFKHFQSAVVTEFLLQKRKKTPWWTSIQRFIFLIVCFHFVRIFRFSIYQNLSYFHIFIWCSVCFHGE